MEDTRYVQEEKWQKDREMHGLTELQGEGEGYKEDKVSCDSWQCARRMIKKEGQRSEKERR